MILGLPEELNSASWFDFNTTVLHSPDVWVQNAVDPVVTLTSAYSAQFDLGLVSTFNGSASSPPPRLNFTITASLALPVQGSAPVQRQINATARWQDVTSPGQGAWIFVQPSSTALVQTVGPYVKTEISVSVYIQHSSARSYTYPLTYALTCSTEALYRSL